MTSSTLPTLYLSHGGGPWPWMQGPWHDAHARLAEGLAQISGWLGTKPKAVLMVSAHWEEVDFTLSNHPNPPMLYDYSGFPENTYHVQYPARGSPQLAERARDLIENAGMAARFDTARGFDHGAFVPIALMYPEADIPMVQLSLRRGLDPRVHLAVGRALAPLRNEGVLIIGSGASYHNLRALGPEAKIPSAAFDDWLQRTLVTEGVAQRTGALSAWQEAPSARDAHPREEHLIPLMVAVGAAERDVAVRFYHENDFFGSLSASSFVFGS